MSQIGPTLFAILDAQVNQWLAQAPTPAEMHQSCRFQPTARSALYSGRFLQTLVTQAPAMCKWLGNVPTADPASASPGLMEWIQPQTISITQVQAFVYCVLMHPHIGLILEIRKIRMIVLAVADTGEQINLVVRAIDNHTSSDTSWFRSPCLVEYDKKQASSRVVVVVARITAGRQHPFSTVIWPDFRFMLQQQSIEPTSLDGVGSLVGPFQVETDFQQAVPALLLQQPLSLLIPEVEAVLTRSSRRRLVHYFALDARWNVLLSSAQAVGPSKAQIEFFLQFRPGGDRLHRSLLPVTCLQGLVTTHPKLLAIRKRCHRLWPDCRFQAMARYQQEKETQVLTNRGCPFSMMDLSCRTQLLDPMPAPLTSMAGGGGGAASTEEAGAVAAETRGLAPHQMRAVTFVLRRLQHTPSQRDFATTFTPLDSALIGGHLLKQVVQGPHNFLSWTCRDAPTTEMRLTYSPTEWVCWSRAETQSCPHPFVVLVAPPFAGNKLVGLRVGERLQRPMVVLLATKQRQEVWLHEVQKHSHGQMKCVAFSASKPLPPRVDVVLVLTSSLTRPRVAALRAALRGAPLVLVDRPQELRLTNDLFSCSRDIWGGDSSTRWLFLAESLPQPGLKHMPFLQLALPDRAIWDHFASVLLGTAKDRFQHSAVQLLGDFCFQRCLYILQPPAHEPLCFLPPTLDLSLLPLTWPESIRNSYQTCLQTLRLLRQTEAKHARASSAINTYRHFIHSLLNGTPQQLIHPRTLCPLDSEALETEMELIRTGRSELAPVKAAQNPYKRRRTYCQAGTSAQRLGQLLAASTPAKQQEHYRQFEQVNIPADRRNDICLICTAMNFSLPSSRGAKNLPLGCGSCHCLFCSSCLGEWIFSQQQQQQPPTCPQCRAQLAENLIRPGSSSSSSSSSGVSMSDDATSASSSSSISWRVAALGRVLQDRKDLVRVVAKTLDEIQQLRAWAHTVGWTENRDFAVCTRREKATSGRRRSRSRKKSETPRILFSLGDAEGSDSRFFDVTFVLSAPLDWTMSQDASLLLRLIRGPSRRVVFVTVAQSHEEVYWRQFIHKIQDPQLSVCQVLDVFCVQ